MQDSINQESIERMITGQVRFTYFLMAAVTTVYIGLMLLI